MEIEVKPYDIDVLGHVSNIVYIRWLEDLRLKLLHMYYPFDTSLEKGISPVLVHTEIDYKKPVKLFDPLVGFGYISSLGKIKLEFKAEFTVNGEIKAIARQEGIFFDVKKEKPVRMPAELKEMYEKFYNESTEE